MIAFLKQLYSRYRRFKIGMSPQQNLLFGFFSYVFFGFLLLNLPWTTKTTVSALDHLFTTVSAVSTTGLVTVSIKDSYTLLGQVVIVILFQLGGIGYLSFTTFFILSTTRKMTHWHKRLLRSEFTLPATIRIRDFLKSVILFTVLMEVLGSIAFLWAFTAGGMSLAEALWPAIFHSVSAFCTAGFSLFDTGFAGYVDNGYVNTIISILAIAGSLGFIVVTDLYLSIRKKEHRISFTTKIVCWGFVMLLLLGTGFFYFSEPSIVGLSDRTRFYAAFFQAMTAMTTVGFNTVDFGNFIVPMLLTTFFLMYVGASPSGTAGGLKITTLTAVFAILKSRIRGKKTVTFLKRQIPYERLYVATSSFIFYTAILFLGFYLLSWSEVHGAEALIFEVASALGTVGLSTGITDALSITGKATLICLMFIGRLGVLTFGIAIWSKTTNNKEEVSVMDDLAV